MQLWRWSAGWLQSALSAQIQFTEWIIYNEWGSRQIGEYPLAHHFFPKTKSLFSWLLQLWVSEAAWPLCCSAQAGWLLCLQHSTCIMDQVSLHYTNPCALPLYATTRTKRYRARFPCIISLESDTNILIRPDPWSIWPNIICQLQNMVTSTLQISILTAAVVSVWVISMSFSSYNT